MKVFIEVDYSSMTTSEVDVGFVLLSPKYGGSEVARFWQTLSWNALNELLNNKVFERYTGFY